MDEDTLYQKLLNAAFRFVSYRPRSSQEIRDFLTEKLTKWKTSGESILEKVLDRLQELSYLDDAKFAAWWIEQRQRFRPKGWRIIKEELRLKGISRGILAELEAEISGRCNRGRDSIDHLSDRETARRALAKKLKFWQKLPILEQKKKIYAYLFRRGFDSDTIGSVIDEILQRE